MAVSGKGQYLFSEVDAARLYQYRFGKEFQFNIAQVNVAPSQGGLAAGDFFYSTNFNTPLYSSIYSRWLTVQVRFNSTMPKDDILNFFLDKRISYNMEVHIKDGENTISARIPINGAFTTLDLSFGGQIQTSSDINVSIDLTTLCDHNTIRAGDLGVKIFYISDCYLDPGDKILLDSGSCVLFNASKTPRQLHFDKPVCAANLTFVDGSPEVVLYCFERDN